MLHETQWLMLGMLLVAPPGDQLNMRPVVLLQVDNLLNIEALHITALDNYIQKQ